MKEKFSRRDFLKLAGLSAASTAIIGGCGEGFTLPSIGEIDPYYIEQIGFDLSFFKNPENIPDSMTTRFGTGKNQYRVVEMTNLSEALGVYNPFAQNNELMLQGDIDAFAAAHKAVLGALARYQGVFQIQQLVDHPSIPEQKVWQAVRIAGTPLHHRSAQTLDLVADKFLQQRWLQDSDPKTRDTAVGLLHAGLMNIELDDDTRRQVISVVARPENVEDFMIAAKNNKDLGLQMSPLPPETPLEVSAMFHLAMSEPAQDNQTCIQVLNIIMEKAGISDCIFVPKVEHELEDEIRHAIDHEFFPIPPKPDVYYVIKANQFAPEGYEKTLYITHDDQNWADLFNYQMSAPFALSEIEAGIAGWTQLTKPEETFNLSQIHNLGIEPDMLVYKLKDESFSYHLVPNKFRGSRDFIKNEPRLRLAPSIRMAAEDPSNARVFLLAEMLRDIFTPIQDQDQPFENWLTNVTDTVRPHIDQVAALSKLGLQTAEEFFARMFMGRLSPDSILHNAILPTNPVLREILLTFYSQIALENGGDDLKKVNWAVGTGRPVPIIKLRGENLSKLLIKTDLFSASKDLEATQLLDENGNPVCLNPGEMLPLAGRIKNNRTGEEYVLVGGIGRDDKGEFFSRLRNWSFSDKITYAYAIPLKDALNHITPIDNDDNIVDFLKDLVKIGGPIAVVLLTIFAPEFLPALALRGSLAVSTRANAVYTALINAISRLIPTL